MEAILIIAVAVFTLAIGLPIGFMILLICVIMIANDPFVNMGVMATIFVQGLDSFILISIPLFILVGVIMNSGGITHRLMEVAVVLVGHLRGGIAQVNIVASMIFSGMSGSTTSDVAALGRMEIPMMIKAGYRPETAAVVTAVSATIGPIIPPSVPFILYGALTSTSVRKLFLGGVIPGVLLGVCLMVVVSILARSGRIATTGISDRWPQVRQILRALRDSFWALLTPLILIGGTVSGYFTPTEAAGVALVYTIFVTGVIYRSINFRQLFAMFCESAEIVGVIMLMVAAANIFGWLITQAGLSSMIMDFASATGQGPIITLLLVMLLLLVLGMIIEATSMIILLSPILWLLVQQPALTRSISVSYLLST
jgi:tripartite ATP-independent transporter DctM subunit